MKRLKKNEKKQANISASPFFSRSICRKTKIITSIAIHSNVIWRLLNENNGNVSRFYFRPLHNRYNSVANTLSVSIIYLSWLQDFISVCLFFLIAEFSNGHSFQTVSHFFVQRFSSKSFYFVDILDKIEVILSNASVKGERISEMEGYETVGMLILVVPRV